MGNAKQRTVSAIESLSNMKVLVFIATFAAFAAANTEDDLFGRYDANHDHCMDSTEFETMWYTFDLDNDGDITKEEFDSHWRSLGLSDKEHAPFFFMEMDRVMDEVLNSADFDHIFRLFDEHMDGCITSREFSFNWEGFFKVD